MDAQALMPCKVECMSELPQQTLQHLLQWSLTEHSQSYQMLPSIVVVQTGHYPTSRLHMPVPLACSVCHTVHIAHKVAAAWNCVSPLGVADVVDETSS